MKWIKNLWLVFLLKCYGVVDRLLDSVEPPITDIYNYPEWAGHKTTVEWYVKDVQRRITKL
jgi:hypothetical protein